MGKRFFIRNLWPSQRSCSSLAPLILSQWDRRRLVPSYHAASSRDMTSRGLKLIEAQLTQQAFKTECLRNLRSLRCIQNNPKHANCVGCRSAWNLASLRTMSKLSTCENQNQVKTQLNDIEHTSWNLRTSLIMTLKLCAPFDLKLRKWSKTCTYGGARARARCSGSDYKPSWPLSMLSVRTSVRFPKDPKIPHGHHGHNGHSICIVYGLYGHRMRWDKR